MIGRLRFIRWWGSGAHGGDEEVDLATSEVGVGWDHEDGGGGGGGGCFKDVFGMGF